MPKRLGYKGVQKDEAAARSGKPPKMPTTKRGSVALAGGKSMGGKKGNYGLK